MEFFGEQLRKAGYNYYGHERMYSGITGQELEVDVFIGTQQLLPPIGVVMTAGLCSSSREDVLVHVLLVVSSSPPPLFSWMAVTFSGNVFYQRLRHMVSDKYQVRATGSIDKKTRQPIKGRKRGGGVRFGEMERDALLAHGTAFLLHDRLVRCSDDSEVSTIPSTHTECVCVYVCVSVCLSVCPSVCLSVRPSL